jgi:uncharacterized protein
MSAPPDLRRKDRAIPGERALAMLKGGFHGRLATVGEDGYPYCVPLLYVFLGDELCVHGTVARGHLRRNVEYDGRASFEIDSPGEVFAYGRFECDSGIGYASVIAFGRIRIVEDAAVKQRFCEALMAKYGDAGWEPRPAGFFPRLAQIAVYALTIERLTGKGYVVPEASALWPALDRTATPDAVPPARA